MNNLDRAHLGKMKEKIKEFRSNYPRGVYVGAHIGFSRRSHEFLLGVYDFLEAVQCDDEADQEYVLDKCDQITSSFPTDDE